MTKPESKTALKWMDAASALTKNEAVLQWMEEMAAMTQPDKIVWITGEEEQLEALRAQAVEEGILIKLNEDGTKAAAEAYMYAACKYRNGMVVVARCRDIDLWEKRDGKWLVVKRTVAGDNTMILHPDFAPDYNNGRDKVKDPSYDYFETIE